MGFNMNFVGKAIKGSKNIVNKVKSNIDCTLHKKAMDNAFKQDPRRISNFTRNEQGLSKRIAENDKYNKAKQNFERSLKDEYNREKGALVPLSTISGGQNVTAGRNPGVMIGNYDKPASSVRRSTDDIDNIRRNLQDTTTKTNRLEDFKDNILSGDWKKYAAGAGGVVAVGGLGYAMFGGKDEKY
jgi:hypothetical protein